MLTESVTDIKIGYKVFRISLKEKKIQIKKKN